MASWEPVLHFESVERGSGLRGDVDVLPPILPPEAYEAAGLRRSGAEASFTVAPARSDDRGQSIGRAGAVVVETPFEGDVGGEMLLVRCDGALRMVVPDRTRGGRSVTVFEAPVSPGPQGDRGPLGTAGRWLVQKVVFPLVDPVLGRISDALVGKWEESRRPYRVRFYTPDDYRSPGTRLAQPADVRPGNVLLLMHGTNSLSHSSSGLGALPPSLVRELWTEYDRQVIAFDHPTLATDPVENAKWFVEHWLGHVDVDIELDVLCHSRGGLVTRLLTERADLVGLKNRDHIRFRSITCVATPHRGTPLGDAEHLGRLVDRLLTLAAPLPDNPVSLALEGALTVARQVAAGFFGGLDGVTCMQPPGAGKKRGKVWLDLLDDGNKRPKDMRYRSIVADFESAAGSGFWHALKDAGVDVVFGGLPNDVVVPTLSALSLGSEPGSGFDDMVVFDPVDGIQHGGYFGHDLVQPVLGAWLRKEPDALPAGSRRRQFSADDARSLAELGPEWSLAKALDLTCVAPVALRPALQRVVETAGAKLWSFVSGRGDTAMTSVVVLVPGIMGSELVVGGDRLWLSPWRLAQGAFAQLRLPSANPADAVVPGDVLCLGYRATVERLSKEFQVVTFPYDWREDIDHAASRLRALLETLLDDPETGEVPLHVVAHSMGGLVTRRALAQAGEQDDAGSPSVQERLAMRGGQVVLAGPPNQGSLATPLALIGRHPVLSWLSRVDVRYSLEEWLDVVWTFPGLLQLLPRPDLSGRPDGHDSVEWLYEPSRWPGRDNDRTEGVLRAARDLHDRLRTSDGSGMHLILGDRVSTPVAIRSIGTDSFEVGMADAGDGTVARRCGELARATTYFAPGVEHGNLVKDPRMLQAIVDILTRGDTKLLSGEQRGVERDESAAEQLDWLSVADAEHRLWPTGVGTRGDSGPPPLVWTRREALDVGLEALAPLLGTTSTRIPPLRVQIVHGSVECAAYPILVGHGTGTPIAGAEGRCDQLLGGHLSSLQMLGLYPDVPNTWRYIPGGGLTDRLNGCLALGLDSSEPLSRGVLTELVARAVLDYVERTHSERTAPEDPDIGRRGAAIAAAPLGLSAVAAGSGPGFGLGAERAVTAIVEGVQRANETLDRAGLPVIQELQFVERYAGQVERIRWAIERLAVRSAAAQDSQALDVDAGVIEGVGRRVGIPSPEYDSGRWEHLSVDADAVDGESEERLLTYRFSRNRAATGETPRRIDRSAVFGLLRHAVESPQQSVELGRVLFEELLPVEIKDELSRIDNLVLQVGDGTADLPWELLGDRLASDQPLACRAGMLRQLRDRVLRVRPSGSIPDTALVIGDPPSNLPPLPSARAEAADIAAVLRGADIDVELIAFPEGATGSIETINHVRKAFWSRDHRIVHVAGHGLYRLRSPDGGMEGGIVIGPRNFLTADDLNNLRAAPDLVFLNCCHLGKVQSDAGASGPDLLDSVGQHQQAASLASTLMRIGVKAVVVAGWQVDDRIASRFASEFYRRMIDGLPYGEAVKQARTACFESSDGQDNTWAAYQCYGDAAFRLSRKAETGRPAIGEVTTRSVALRRLEDVRTRCEEIADHELLHREANELDEQVHRRWPTDGELQAAVGDVWAALGGTGTAIERYEHAVAAATSTAPLRSLELLANLCSRRALELHRACDVAGLPDTEVDGYLVKAERWTTVLQKIGLDTAERCALNAGHYKRLAILRPIRRTEDLRNAIDAYVAALKLDAGYIYCFRNAMQLAAIQGGEVSPSLETLLADAELIGRWASDATRPLSDAEFWLRVGYADSRLTAALIDPHQQLGEDLVDRLRALGDDDASRATAALIESDLSSQIDDLAIAYGNARAGGFMQLGWHSIVEHVTDLEELARTADLAVAPALRHLTDRLARIDV